MNRTHLFCMICKICNNNLITSGQSNLTQGRIAAADGRFNRIRKLAPMCPPMRAHWRNLANTIELVLTSANPSPQPKEHFDRFSRFCTAHCRLSLYITMGAPFPKIAPFHGGSEPHLIHDTFSSLIQPYLC